MERKHVAVVVGTRPEAIKLFPVIFALRKVDDFRVSVWTTGQHSDLVNQVLLIAELEVDVDLKVMTPGQSLDVLTVRLLGGLGSAMDHDPPHWVIVQGDTTSAMVASLAAFYRRIKVAHVEAGLRTGDNYSPWPEEVNRRVISTMANLHFAPTLWASHNLFRENIDEKIVHVTGNTGIDALRFVRNRLPHLKDFTQSVIDVLRPHEDRKIIVVTAHRRENFEGGMTRIAAALSVLEKRDDVIIIFPVHPNPRVMEVMKRELSGCERILLVPPLDYVAFVYLMTIATLILTDSGGIQEEAASFGTPVLILRNTTERPEGVEAGISRLVGTDPVRIVEEAERLLDDQQSYALMSGAPNPYGDGHASERISEILRAQL